MSSTEAAQILIDNGWHFTEECFCGGALKHIYRNKNLPGYEVNLFVKYYEFNIKHYMSTITSRKPYDQLTTIIATI